MLVKEESYSNVNEKQLIEKLKIKNQAHQTNDASIKLTAEDVQVLGTEVLRIQKKKKSPTLIQLCAMCFKRD